MELTPHQSTAWHYRALCEMGRAGDLCGKTILTNGRRRSSVTLATSFVHQQATGRSRFAAVANKSSVVVEPNGRSAQPPPHAIILSANTPAPGRLVGPPTGWAGLKKVDPRRPTSQTANFRRLRTPGNACARSDE